MLSISFIPATLRILIAKSFHCLLIAFIPNSGSADHYSNSSTAIPSLFAISIDYFSSASFDNEVVFTNSIDYF